MAEPNTSAPSRSGATDIGRGGRVPPYRRAVAAAGPELPDRRWRRNGTFELESTSGVYTEIQAGSYVFMDADYAQNLDGAGMPVSTFRQALFVLATVMSTPQSRIAVLDVGHKSVAVDSGLPEVWQASRYPLRQRGRPNMASLRWRPKAAPPQLGEKLRLVPGHCDPTVDRHDGRSACADGGWNAYGRCPHAAVCNKTRRATRMGAWNGRWSLARMSVQPICWWSALACRQQPFRWPSGGVVTTS